MLIRPGRTASWEIRTSLSKRHARIHFSARRTLPIITRPFPGKRAFAIFHFHEVAWVISMYLRVLGLLRLPRLSLIQKSALGTWLRESFIPRVPFPGEIGFSRIIFGLEFQVGKKVAGNYGSFETAIWGWWHVLLWCLRHKQSRVRIFGEDFEYLWGELNIFRGFWG